jgi:hypothetical protein
MSKTYDNCKLINSFKSRLSQKKGRVQIRTEFAPGDQVVGIFDRIEPPPTATCATDVLVIVDENGIETGIWFSEYIKNAMQRQGAKSGHLISVKCVREFTTEAGNVRPTLEVDFDDPANYQ